MESAATIWKLALESWAIPPEILAQAPELPWIHPPALFGVPDQITETPSHRIAREALPPGGSVLDIGCGGGVAAMALIPPAIHVIGLDHQSAMLEMFTANATKRGATSEVFEGFWPAIAADVPIADVVTCHHVVYNVADIASFLSALDKHATKRVVIEMPQHHPHSAHSEAWKYFWNLDRPIVPTPQELLDVLSEIGIVAQVEYWDTPLPTDRDLSSATEFTRIRLCLTADRDPEIRSYLESQPLPSKRELATIWWDK